MDTKTTTRISKHLSLVLRHDPASIGISLDESGWTDVDALLAALNAHGTAVTREQLDHVVATNDKKRFAFSDDGRQIRASQGHSVEVDLKYADATPPELLYHGTATRFVDSIKAGGLLPAARHDVHLSSNAETAHQVGQRHGVPVVLVIRAGDMARAGHTFRISVNGVWLTAGVPAAFIDFPREAT